MIKIRKATIKDLKDVLTLNTMLFKKEVKDWKKPFDCTWTFSKLGTKYFAGQIKKGSIFVAADGDKIVGYLACISYEPETWRKVKRIGELDSTFVLPEYRSQGIGKKLFQAFIKWCKSKKVGRIKVVASAENLRAIEFYRKNGFKDQDLVLETNI